MQELTRSMIRFTWVMPLFGLEQLSSLVSPKGAKHGTAEAAEALDHVSGVAQGQLSKPFRDAFETGDKLSRQMVDTMFKVVDVEALNPLKMLEKTTDVVRDALGGKTRRAAERG